MEILVMLFFAILGLLIGSFLNVCIYRIPREEEIVYTPSHCMHCNTRIKWYDLIPVFSFLVLKGRCRSCGKTLSLQYPLIELVNGLVYGGIFWLYGMQIETLLFSALFSILLVISLIDLRHYIIPNGLVVAIIALGLIHLILNYERWLDYVIGFFAVSVVLLLMAIITRGSMGGGDIKLMAAAGLLLGWELILLALMIGSIIGSVVGLTLMAMKIITRKQMIPFGPFLSAGIFIAALFGHDIFIWYFNTMIDKV